MLRFLEDKGALFPYSWESIDALTSRLRGFLCTRRTYSAPKKVRPDFILKLFFNSNRMQRLAIRKIFGQPEVINLWPEGAVDFLNSLLVCNRLVTPVGGKILNFSRVAKGMVAADNLATCRCMTLFPGCASRDGHVFTGDLSFLPQPLRRLAEYGPQFREGQGLEVSVAGLSVSLDDLVEQIARASGDLDPALFDDWRSTVLHKSKSFLSSRPDPRKAELGRARVVAKLAWYQRHLVFVPTDKAANNIAAICKHSYVDYLTKELTSESGAYEVCQDTEEVILERISADLECLELSSVPKWAYLYMMPKLHKRGERFIAGGRVCVTTGASKILTGLLTAVLASLRREDDALIRSKGYKRVLVVDGYEEVALGLKRLRFLGKARMRTGDFVTMYTTLPHEDLIMRVGGLVDAACVYEKSVRRSSRGLYLCERSDGTFSWGKAKGPCYEDGKLKYSVQDVKYLIAFVVNNTYVMNGGVLRRQVIGIPMGTNCAPLLANLYLASCEREYMDRVWSENPARAQRMRSCYRLIDDLLAVNCPGVEDFLHEVYPKQLKLSWTNTTLSEANFIGISLKHVVGESRLRLDVYDKRKAFPFRVRNYPHLDSVIPKSQAYGVFTGQLHRFHRICDDWEDFVKWAVDMGSYMALERGYSRLRLLAKFGNFCHREDINFQGTKPRVVVAAFKSQMFV